MEFLKRCAFVLAVLTGLSLDAQVSQFAVSFRVGNAGVTNNFEQTADGGYIISSLYTDTVGYRHHWGFLTKLDTAGNMQWAKKFFVLHGYTKSQGNALCEAHDRGYLLATEEEYFDTLQGAYRAATYLIKTDTAGNVQWSQLYRGLGMSYCYDVKLTADHGFIVCGMTYDTALLLKKYGFVLRVDSAGNMLWAKAYNEQPAPSVQTQSFYSVSELQNGDFIVCGDYAVLRLDNQGNVIWSKQIGMSVTFFNIKEMPGGDLICVGTDNLINGCNVVLRFDSAGALLWGNYYCSGNSMYTYSIVPTWDGFTLCVSGNPNTPVPDGARLFHMDPSGNTLWAREYPVADAGGSVLVRTTDGGYAFEAFRMDFSYFLNAQQLIVKTDSMGMTRCYSAPITEQRSPIVAGAFVSYTGFNATLTRNIQTIMIPYAVADTFYCENDPAGQEEAAMNVESLRVYPNPASDVLTITMHDAGQAPVTISVCNALGQTVYEKQVKPLSQTVSETIDVAGFRSGLYFITIAAEGLPIAQRKFIRE